ncbi:flagellar basal body P-ring formation chaperone FlgA [Pseudoduganella violaceinigra]|uniref:flagellar basal body P-ring formation chaperone FlgA n=1 Tax=Pseudoduganella violaceinigra TaxID=246602 RepID=UPI0005521315|nr:flagellar basal body P-ring formation chaperone FlgA [Pseudoduganella violaceinigra]
MSNNPIVQVFGGLLLIGILNCRVAIAAAVEDLLSKVQLAAVNQLQNHAQAQHWRDPQFDVEVLRTNRSIPACPSETRVESMDARGIARMRFVVVCPSLQGWRYEFLVKGKVSAKVAVAATDLMSGKILSPLDLLQERHDITLIPDAFSDPGELGGMAARRSIRAGEVLRQNMLVAPQLVKRGDQVRIVARREQIEVSMAGEALDNGSRGAVIRVKNSSGNQIRARVIEAGTVEPADLP